MLVVVARVCVFYDLRRARCPTPFTLSHTSLQNQKLNTPHPLTQTQKNTKKQVELPLLRQLYDAYSFNVIPALGGLVAGDADSYRYLVESIRTFPDQAAFAEMVRDAGFAAVTYENFTGGVVALHSGFKL